MNEPKDGWDEELEIRKARAHDKECELAALAVLKERVRLRPTNKRKGQPAQSPEDYDDLGRKQAKAMEQATP